MNLKNCKAAVSRYGIAGNFGLVQIFVYFVGCLAVPVRKEKFYI